MAYKQTIKEKIQQRRLQMFVHSFLYYERNVSIVSDYQWSMWAKELADLQAKYPEESSAVIYAEEFKNWDGSTGADLKIPDKFKIRADLLYKQHVDSKPKKKAKRKRSLF